MSEEYKKYDSQAGSWVQNARLAKDAQVIEGGEKPLVKLTFVLTSRSDRHSDMWVEAAVQDRQSSLAAYLKKGDELGVAGFPALRRWGDNDEKFSIEWVRAEIFPSIELFSELKERGFEPGAQPAKKGKKTTKPAKGRKILDDDDDLPGDDA